MEKIFDKVESTLREMESQWQAIGYSDEMKVKSLETFAASVGELCAQSVALLRREQEKLQAEESRTLEMIQRLAKQLGNDIELSAEVMELPLCERLNVLQTHLQALREQIGARRHTLEELHDTLHGLWEDLGISADDAPEYAPFAKAPASTDLLSLERIAEYERLIAEAQAAKQERSDRIAERVLQLIDLWNLLEMSPSNEFDQAVLDGNLGCTLEVFKTLDEHIQVLSTEKERRECKIREYGMKINTLWDKLQVPLDEREEFFDRSAQTLGPEAIRGCEAELERLEQLYKNSLKKLIEDLRAKLQEQWQKLRLAKEDRINFSAFTSEAYSEQLLEVHQEEVEQNERLIATIEPILKLIETRENLLKKKAAYEQETSDPKRLLSKGRNAGGRLLREEKTRKILHKLPQTEDELLRSLREWEAQSGKMFVFGGEPYLAALEQQMQESASKMRKRKPLIEKETNTDEEAATSNQLDASLRAGSSRDLSASVTTPRSTMKRPATPGKAPAPPKPATAPRTATPFASTRKAAVLTSGKRAAPTTPSGPPRTPFAAIQANSRHQAAASPSATCMKRPRLNL